MLFISAVIDRRRGIRFLTTTLGQWWFPRRANETADSQDNVIAAQRLSGQSFTAAGYFCSRPPPPPIRLIIHWRRAEHDASNPELDAQIQARVAALRANGRVPRFRLSWRRRRQAGCG